MNSWYKIATSTITLYHGTNSWNFEKIKKDGYLNPFTKEDIINNISDKDIQQQFSDEFDLRMKLNKMRFGVEHGVYLTPSRNKGIEYADPHGGEIIRDISHVTGTELNSYRPVLLTFEIPTNFLPSVYSENVTLMEETGLPPEDLFEQVIIDKPIPKEYISNVEFLN